MVVILKIMVVKQHTHISHQKHVVYVQVHSFLQHTCQNETNCFLISNVHAFSVCVAKALHVLYMPYGMVNIISSYNAVCAVFAIAKLASTTACHSRHIHCYNIIIVTWVNMQHCKPLLYMKCHIISALLQRMFLDWHSSL